MTSSVDPPALYQAISSLDAAARVPALRGISNWALAKCISAICQYVCEAGRSSREQHDGQGSLDKASHHNASIHTRNAIRKAMGITGCIDPLRQASILHAVHESAYKDLGPLIFRGDLRKYERFSEGMSLKSMLEFMSNNAGTLDKEVLEQIAETLGTDITSIGKMVELESRRERQKLCEKASDIISIFESFDANDYAGCIEKLSKPDQHLLALKTVDNLKKARQHTIAGVMRTHKLTDLAKVSLIDVGAERIAAWVDDFELAYEDDIKQR